MPLSTARLLRALDGLLICLIGTILITPRVLLNDHVLPTWDLVYLLPPAGLAIFGFLVPTRLPGIEQWHREVNRLRWMGMIAAGMAPFYLWWISSQEGLSMLVDSQTINVGGIRLYLLVNCFTAGLFAVLWLISLNVLTIELARWTESPVIEMEAKFNRYLLIYVQLISYIALATAMVAIYNSDHSIGSVYIALQAATRFSGFAWLLFIPLMPILLSLTLLFRTRLAVARRLEAELQVLGKAAARGSAPDLAAATPESEVGTSSGSAAKLAEDDADSEFGNGATDPLLDAATGIAPSTAPRHLD